MRFVTIVHSGLEQAAVRIEDSVVPIANVNRVIGTEFPTSIEELVLGGKLGAFAAQMQRVLDSRAVADLHPVRLSDCQFCAPYRHPRKIWGIGLNYREHAGDLNAVLPTEEPASFMKADTTLIGPADVIVLPPQSERVTAEAELAIVIGKACRNVSLEEAPEVVAGFTAVIDMTAEDILQKNPRYLTRAKNFDTFFSFGPELVTPDEVEDLEGLRVETWHNGSLYRQNTVSNMTFLPWFLVSFHSQVMTLLPGDIISTGTPGAVVIRDGDTAECRMDGFLPLVNPVRGGGAE